MDLRAIYPDDIPRECRDFAATLDAEAGGSRRERLTALAVADLFEMLESRPGPAKWVRLAHYQSLWFFAIDPREHPRQLAQVVIHVGPPHPAGLTTVEYLLPVEQRPWKSATATATTTIEAANLVFDGLERCESRRENLVDLD
jgi:hypothetical protein